MANESSEHKNILVQIFDSPEELFISYFLKGKEVSFKQLTFLHIMLWIFAPLFRLFHNLTSIYVIPLVWRDYDPVKLTSGLLVSALIYPVFYVLILQIDVIRLYYRGSLQNYGGNPRHLILLSFLPFSASFLFWILPFPLNTIFILFAFAYSIWLSYLSMRIASNYKPKQFMEFLLATCFYFLTIALFFNILFHIYREVIL
ncbi:MAG: hypothetical protein H7A23_02005 [Leptospiraceae bacterium]|nr:hypothetical protein [Leptospiraceae bacterium]MCP5493303.1 hypothetical protein [Leptospiraceae bacterium]